jgi:hypothetical protein
MPAWLWRRVSAIQTTRRRRSKEGRIPPNWKAKPAKLRHKDRDARWTVKFTKAKPREDGSMPPLDLAIPLFGYRNHVSIDRRFGFIRRWAATDATAYEGRRLRRGFLNKTNTKSGVWADTVYRSAANETFLNKNGFVSHIHSLAKELNVSILALSQLSRQVEALTAYIPLGLDWNSGDCAIKGAATCTVDWNLKSRCCGSPAPSPTSTVTMISSSSRSSVILPTPYLWKSFKAWPRYA